MIRTSRKGPRITRIFALFAGTLFPSSFPRYSVLFRGHPLLFFLFEPIRAHSRAVLFSSSFLFPLLSCLFRVFSWAALLFFFSEFIRALSRAPFFFRVFSCVSWAHSCFAWSSSLWSFRAPRIARRYFSITIFSSYSRIIFSRPCQPICSLLSRPMLMIRSIFSARS